MKRNVLLTGFGLFRDHQLNPSWEAIKDDKIKINSAKNINIITKQIDVAYKDVDEVVSKLCDQYKPFLIVHVGLANHETSIRLEVRARHGPYIHDDVTQFAPHKHLRQYHHDEGCLEENVVAHRYSCKPCQFDYCTTSINVDKLCDKMNDLYKKGKLKIPTTKSTDAGLYLCEYIYQKSLNLCKNNPDSRCLFIHVPNIDNFQLDDITASIQQVVELLIDQCSGD